MAANSSRDTHAVASSLLLSALKRDNPDIDEHTEAYLLCTADMIADHLPDQPKRARSIAYNLPRNPELRRALLAGELTPLELCELDANDLASETVKRARSAAVARAEAQMRAARTDENDLFSSTRSVRCPECGGGRARFKHLGTDMKDWHGRKNEVWGTKHNDDEGFDCLIVCSKCDHEWHGNAPEVHEEDTADDLEQARRKDFLSRPEPESVHKRA